MENENYYHENEIEFDYSKDYLTNEDICSILNENGRYVYGYDDFGVYYIGEK